MSEHKMHKPARQLSPEDTLLVLQKGHHGTLSVNGDDGFPYATPVNYVVVDGKIYIHTAKYGYKIECLQRDAKCCFSAIVNALVMPDKVTAAFESVIATGTATFVEDPAEIRKVMEAFVRVMCVGHEQTGYDFMEKALKVVGVIRIDHTEMTGKAYAREMFK